MKKQHIFAHSLIDTNKAVTTTWLSAEFRQLLDALYYISGVKGMDSEEFRVNRFVLSTFALSLYSHCAADLYICLARINLLI